MSTDPQADSIDDPFWSVVHERHPDLDIVLLPPAPPRPVESGLPRRTVEPFERIQLEDMDALWEQLVGHGMPQRAAMWIPGPTNDSVCHTITLTLENVGETAGIGHLRESIALLTNDGWNVFTPPTGMPRLYADRPGELGDETLLFGYAAVTQRLFARLTSTGLPVDPVQARVLIGGAA